MKKVTKTIADEFVLDNSWFAVYFIEINADTIEVSKKRIIGWDVSDINVIKGLLPPIPAMSYRHCISVVGFRTYVHQDDWEEFAHTCKDGSNTYVYGYKTIVC